MVEINGTTIKMTRGDTLRTQITMYDAQDQEYVPQDGDSIRFAMKRAYSDEEPLLVKIIPNETQFLVLDPADTKDLEAPGTFVYDIQITFADGDVDTFVSKAKLKLLEEVD